MASNNTKFSAQVDEFVRQSEFLMDGLLRQSVQDVIDDAQLSDDKGGRMRIDTGFLRASGQISLTGMPTGPERGEPEAKYEWAAQPVEVTIAGIKSGDTIYFGWSASYAAAREFKDGFLSGAVQNWPEIVMKNAKALK